MSSEPPAKRFRVDESSDAVVYILTVATPRRKVECIQDWIEAWSIFSLIASAGAADSCSGLLEHQLRVIQAAQKYRFSAVLEYDVRVRQVIAKDTHRKIGEMHTEPYTQCFTGQALTICTRCKKPGHAATSCMQRPPGQGKFRLPSSNTSEKPVCKQYNKGACNFSNCTYLHRCTFCRGSHKAVECPTCNSA